MTQTVDIRFKGVDRDRSSRLADAVHDLEDFNPNDTSANRFRQLEPNRQYQARIR
jgi:hypothetical protein